MKQLFLIDNPAGKEYDLTQMIQSKIDLGREPEITLGRRSSTSPTDITLGAGLDCEKHKSLLGVSREHARIRYDGGEFRLSSEKVTCVSRYSEDGAYSEESTPGVESYALEDKDNLMFSNWFYGPVTISSKRVSK